MFSRLVPNILVCFVDASERNTGIIFKRELDVLMVCLLIILESFLDFFYLFKKAFVKPFIV